MCVCTHKSILCNIIFFLPQLTTAGDKFASVRFKVCSSKHIHPPCYSHKVLPASLLFLGNCRVLSLLILHQFGSRGFVDGGLWSCLEALPFSGAHTKVHGTARCHHTLQYKWQRGRKTTLRNSTVPPDQVRIIAIQGITACFAYLGYIFLIPLVFTGQLICDPAI